MRILITQQTCCTLFGWYLSYEENKNVRLKLDVIEISYKWDEDLRQKEKLAIDSILCHSSAFSHLYTKLRSNRNQVQSLRFVFILSNSTCLLMTNLQNWNRKENIKTMLGKFIAWDFIAAILLIIGETCLYSTSNETLPLGKVWLLFSTSSYRLHITFF